MRRALSIALLMLLLLVGCTSSPTYKEGTLLDLGFYLPYDGGLVGLQLVQYLNGCKLNASTNFPFEVERKFAATNDYFFGMVKTVESTDTKVKVNR